MHPAVKKIRLKMTNTGEKRIAYSQKEALSMIGIPYSRSQWQQWEQAQMIPPSFFVFQIPYYTLNQITLLKAWATGQLPQNVNPQTYLYAHWSDPDPKEEEDYREKVKRKEKCMEQQITKLEALAELSRHTALPVAFLEAFDQLGIIPPPAEGKLYTHTEIEQVRSIWARIVEAGFNKQDVGPVLLAIKAERAQAK